MTDKQIIKALEYCVKTEFIRDCAKCEMLAFDCKDILIENAFDLINRQKAKIENEIKEIKSEAIKEFARELKCGVPQETGVIRCKEIDDLVKQMTEVQE